MEETDWWLRTRAVVSNRGVEIAVLLVVLALVGGWITYTTHIDPGTETEERVITSWSRTADFDHGATVQRSNPVFEEGERLSNRSVYFTRVAPVLDGNYTLGYAATDGETLNATVDLTLVIQGVTGEEGEEPLWRTTTMLERRSAIDLRPGQTLRVPFSVDVPEVRNRSDDIASTLGTVGETEIFVQADVRLEREGERGTDMRSFRQTLGVVPEADVYRVSESGQPTAQYETTEPVLVTRDHGLPRTVGGPLVLFVSVVGLLVLGIGHQWQAFALTEQERTWLAYQADRTEFEEWIHTVQLPSEAHDRPQARANSLAALVEFAIDVDSGVLESPDGGVFYVIHDDYLYTYTAPLPPDWSEATPSPTTLTDETRETGVESERD